MPELQYLAEIAKAVGVTGVILALFAFYIWISDRREKRKEEKEKEKELYLQKIVEEHKEDMKEANKRLVELNEKQLEEQRKSRQSIDTIVSVIDHIRSK